MARTSFKLSAALRDQLRIAVERDGYGPRGKSRWLCEALLELSNIDPALLSVGKGEDTESHTATEFVVLTKEALRVLQLHIQVLVGQDALMTGIRSQILRAAIRGRLGL